LHLIGSYLGSRLILSFDQKTAAKIVLLMLPIAALMLLLPKDRLPFRKVSQKDYSLKVPIISLMLGIYDGFFGPGTGSFLAMSFYLFLGLGLLESTANAKVINFLTNIGALAGFIIAGKVIYALAVPLACSCMIGNYLGSHLALKKGKKIIKLFLVIVLAILFVTLIWKMF